MRNILTGALLCVLASTAFAAEHYVEVWNPPEARIGGAHASAQDKKCRSKKVAKRHAPSADHVTPRRVAQPALPAPDPVTPSSPATRRHPLIAPKMGPDGHFLQVGYRPRAQSAWAATRVE
ncbi:MAG TPA: hypothetical protein VL689_07625 [Paraburkholderia sp.]|nr:hypothetical protein [Paraburkholderia sp.]